MNSVDTLNSLSAVDSRQNERFQLTTKAHWDFFTAGTGRKSGYITDISVSGCLLQSCEPIEHRRWVRLLIEDPYSNLSISLIGRVVRCENQLEAVTENEFTLYRHGIQFTHPACLTQDQADLILALSSRNLSVLSCLNRNKKSSLRPGFLA